MAMQFGLDALQYRGARLSPALNPPRPPMPAAERPRFNAVGALDAAEKIRSSRLANEGSALTNQLSRIKVNEATDQHNALQAYRDARAGGDPNAMSRLARYPELASQMGETLLKMDKVDRDRAIIRGLQLADAAKSVALLPPGSEERRTMWNTQLDRLKERGVIGQEQYDAFYDKPSDLVLDQALAGGEALEDFIKRHNERPGKRDLQTIYKDGKEQKGYFDANGEWADVGGPKGGDTQPKSYADLTFDQKQEVDKIVNDRLEIGISEYDPPTAKEMNKRRRKIRQDVLREYFGAPDKTTAPGTRKSPVEFQGSTADEINREFEALESGAWFINPADGKLMQKR